MPYQIKQATSLIIHRHFPVLNGSLTSAVWLQHKTANINQVMLKT